VVVVVGGVVTTAEPAGTGVTTAAVGGGGGGGGAARVVLEYEMQPEPSNTVARASPKAANLTMVLVSLRLPNAAVSTSLSVRWATA